MTGTKGSIAQLFFAGEYGRIVEHTRQLQPDTKTDPERSALIAHALFEAGDLTRAHAWAASCAESSHAVARARAQLVLALHTRAKGNLAHASQQLQSALRLAEDAQDDELEAWIAIALLRHMFVGGRDLTAAMVHTTRAKAAKAGSPHVTAYLHATVAVAEGQAGRLNEARRHLRIAQKLADTKPHAWLRCSILATTTVMALAECEFNEAENCLRELRTVARGHGLTIDYARAGVNLGNLLFLTGQYDAAEAAIQEAMDSPYTSRIAKLTAAETLAQIRLSQGRLNDCDNILRDIERASDEASLTNVFGVQAARLTHARLLIRRGEALGAVEQLMRLESDLGEPSDRVLLAATRMTAAQALVECGDSAAGAKYLAASLRLDPAGIPELQGQFYFAAAAAIAGSNRQLAERLRARARRLWAFQGTSALELALATTDDAPDAALDTKLEITENASLIESIASVFALASTPRLLALELQELIGALGCSPRVQLSTERESSTVSKEVALELFFHDKDSTSLKLACEVPASPEQALALSSVVRIGEFAIELERLREAERQRVALWPDASVEASAGAIFDSDAMRHVLAAARRIAATTVPVLISGETGTGKEVVARLIHACSGRAKEAFAPFNCTSLSRDMIESQLFGHRKGAFTGATDHAQGIVRAANRGTLLLDEIGDMPAEVQPKVLRFLESGEIHPLGDPRPISVDVRVIAATNVDLKGLISSGRFREDLYYRLSIVPLHLPPLRERRGEIPSLANHYLGRYAQEFGKGDLKLSADALEYLLLFRWPGNIRQLANEMRRVAALAEVGALVMPEHLSTDILGYSTARRTEIAPESHENEVIVRLDQPLAQAVEHIERAMIVRAMAKAEGGMERAAAMLGLSRKGLYLKRQKYQLGSPPADALELEADVAS